MSKALRHFLDLNEIPTKELRNMLASSVAMKAELKGHGKPKKPLEGKTLAMIFEKPSTRTRVSFDVGMRQLGGESIMLTGAEMQLGRGETIADTARVLSRYVDAIMIRILNHEALLELAQYATVPVINGLTRRSHPCQVMADVMTFEEHRGPIRGKTVAWTGDANNVLASWMHAAERFDFRLRVATPPELAPKKWLLDWIKSSGAAIKLGSDPEEAVRQQTALVLSALQPKETPGIPVLIGLMLGAGRCARDPTISTPTPSMLRRMQPESSPIVPSIACASDRPCSPTPASAPSSRHAPRSSPAGNGRRGPADGRRRGLGHPR
jgi:ornithine carbamoyltransferase